MIDDLTQMAIDLGAEYELTMPEAMDAVDLINDGWDVDEAIEAVAG